MRFHYHGVWSSTIFLFFSNINYGLLQGYNKERQYIAAQGKKYLIDLKKKKGFQV